MRRKLYETLKVEAVYLMDYETFKDVTADPLPLLSASRPGSSPEDLLRLADVIDCGGKIQIAYSGSNAADRAEEDDRRDVSDGG
jgi:hypothetical protein